MEKKEHNDAKDAGNNEEDDDEHNDEDDNENHGDDDTSNKDENTASPQAAVLNKEHKGGAKPKNTELTRRNRTSDGKQNIMIGNVNILLLNSAHFWC